MFSRLIIGMALLGLLGCGKTEPVPVAGGSDPKSKAHDEEMQKAKLEQEAFLADLKKNPQPILDFAVLKIKEGLPGSVGDENAKTAVVTVDPSSLKTLGPDKWTVCGHLSARNKQGKQEERTWQITAEADYLAGKDTKRFRLAGVEWDVERKARP